MCDQFDCAYVQRALCSCDLLVSFVAVLWSRPRHRLLYFLQCSCKYVYERASSCFGTGNHIDWLAPITFVRFVTLPFGYRHCCCFGSIEKRPYAEFIDTVFPVRAAFPHFFPLQPACIGILCACTCDFWLAGRPGAPSYSTGTSGASISASSAIVSDSAPFIRLLNRFFVFHHTCRCTWKLVCPIFLACNSSQQITHKMK